MEPIQLNEIDRRIVNALARHGRIPYKELAKQVGIPTSTCHGRVQALEERGVIRGYRVEIDPEALGKSVSALIMFRVHSSHRDKVDTLSDELRRVPGVQQVFMIGGDKDIIVHVACESVPALRQLIAEHFGDNPMVTQTQTQLVFEHLPGLSPG